MSDGMKLYVVMKYYTDEDDRGEIVVITDDSAFAAETRWDTAMMEGVLTEIQTWMLNGDVIAVSSIDTPEQLKVSRQRME